MNISKNIKSALANAMVAIDGIFGRSCPHFVHNPSDPTSDPLDPEYFLRNAVPGQVLTGQEAEMLGRSLYIAEGDCDFWVYSRTPNGLTLVPYHNGIDFRCVESVINQSATAVNLSVSASTIGTSAVIMHFWARVNTCPEGCL